MDNTEKDALENLVLAPYLQKATALIGKRRRVGGNQFRHAMATLAILIDYHVTDPIILKASVIHDLLEDVPATDPEEIARIDADGREVLRLVREVTRGRESKLQYLERLREHGSKRAKTLKVADRLSNLTDLHLGVFGHDFMRRYVQETAEYVVPMAFEVNANMAIELQDLLEARRLTLEPPRDRVDPGDD
jgi:GTP pyrophosphokinase